jgi:hypothetical protein
MFSDKFIFTTKAMKIVNHDEIEYYENDEEFGLSFKKPISPKVLIDAIKKIDG